MKMITAIVNKKDSAAVCDALREKGYIFTKVASSGGFLSTGNVTILMGTEDHKVEEAVEIIRSNSARRMEPAAGSVVADYPMYSTIPAEVPVGGATVFVTNVEFYEKM